MNPLNFILILVATVFFLLIAAIKTNSKRIERKGKLERLNGKLWSLSSRHSMKFVSTKVLYQSAMSIFNDIVSDNILSRDEKYNILYELNEIMSLHLSYRIRLVKNSSQFLENFKQLFDGGTKLIIEKEEESFIKLKERLEIKGMPISLFWNDKHHAQYAILDEKDHLMTIIYCDWNNKKYRESNYADIYNSIHIMKGILSSFLENYPNSPISNELRNNLETLKGMTY